MGIFNTYDPADSRTAFGGSFAPTLLPDPVPGASYDAAQATCTYDDGTTCTLEGQHDLIPARSWTTGTGTSSWRAADR